MTGDPDVGQALARRDKGPVLPAVIADAGDIAARRFFEFFVANYRNKNTRSAYTHAVALFMRWCESRGLTLHSIDTIAVSAYAEELTGEMSAPSVNVHLTAIRKCLQWLVDGNILAANPATLVRGPKHKTKKGKTPVLSAEETRTLLDSIETEREEKDGIRTPDLRGLRDRALIATLVFQVARVSAVLKMKVQDYFPDGKRWRVRFHEKGSKYHELPAHLTAEEYLDAYIAAAGIAEDKKGPLFRSAPGASRTLSRKPLSRRNALHMIERRAKAAGIRGRVCCHTFRATGITNYLENGGTIEKARAMAAHESSETTELYNRTDDKVTLDEILRIRI